MIADLQDQVVSDRCQHSDEAVASIVERKDAECVEGSQPGGGGGKKPVEVFLVDALGEEGDDPEEVTRIGVEATECWGGKGKFNSCSKTLVVMCLKYLRSFGVPFPRHSVVVPRVMGCGGSE
jgi:hypothetical protein